MDDRRVATRRAFWGSGGAIGAGVSGAIGAPWPVWVFLVLAGYAIGYIAARQLLRSLYARRAQLATH